MDYPTYDFLELAAIMATNIDRVILESGYLVLNRSKH